MNTSYQKLPFGSGDYPDKLFSKFFSGQASILSFVAAVVAVRRQMLNSPPSRVF